MRFFHPYFSSIILASKVLKSLSILKFVLHHKCIHNEIFDLCESHMHFKMIEMRRNGLPLRNKIINVLTERLTINCNMKVNCKETLLEYILCLIFKLQSVSFFIHVHIHGVIASCRSIYVGWFQLRLFLCPACMQRIMAQKQTLAPFSRVCGGEFH